ncbi:MAG: hypothetical protein AAFP00_09655, partial [Bacteroidota bacterium]
FWNKNFFWGGALLVILLSAQGSWALPKSKQGSSGDITKVGLDFDLGLPYLWLLPSSVTSDINEKGNSRGSVSFSAGMPMSLGVTVGYGFLVNKDESKTAHFGPEMGLRYGFTRRLTVRIDDSAGHIEETYLQIPLGINLRTFNGNYWNIKSGSIIGYEFDVLLSSKLRVEGNTTELPAWVRADAEKKIKEIVEDLPALSGSIFVGDTIEFPKGIYLTSRLKIPMDVFSLFSAEKSEDFKDSQRALTKTIMHLVRAASSPFIEFCLGVDIMQVL